jgi:hypothetical protein
MGGLPTIRSYVNKAKRDDRAELIASLPRPHFEFPCRCESYFETNDLVASHSGAIQPVRRAVNSQKLSLPDTPHSCTRPLNFLWYAVTTYKPLKHLSLAAPLSA